MFLKIKYRECNEAADEVAKNALQWKRDFRIDECAVARARPSPLRYLRVFPDGSHCDGIVPVGRFCPALYRPSGELWFPVARSAGVVGRIR